MDHLISQNLTNERKINSIRDSFLSESSMFSMRIKKIVTFSRNNVALKTTSWDVYICI